MHLIRLRIAIVDRYKSFQYRAEAAERLSDNREAAIADILKNSGVQALATNGDTNFIK